MTKTRWMFMFDGHWFPCTPKTRAAQVTRAAAELSARVARADIRVIAMCADNAERQRRGEALAWNSDAFLAIIDEEGIGHNAVVEALSV